MRNTRIYTEQALRSRASFVLAPEPSRHIARSLRMAVGDSLTVFDGRGGEYAATIEAIDKKQVSVLTGEHDPVERESPLDIQLGIGLSRGERLDWVIQKATELGVRSIAPLSTERTGVQLNSERRQKKLAHWHKIAISACEQCGRNILPRIEALQTLDEWLDSTVADQRIVLSHHAAKNALEAQRAQRIALLVGPEGGLDRAEIDKAEEAGYAPLALGPRILRTETAPLAAITVLQARWGDMLTE